MQVCKVRRIDGQHLDVWTFTSSAHASQHTQWLISTHWNPADDPESIETSSVVFVFDKMNKNQRLPACVQYAVRDHPSFNQK
jgi:hypothetical protein